MLESLGGLSPSRPGPYGGIASARFLGESLGPERRRGEESFLRGRFWLILVPWVGEGASCQHGCRPTTLQCKTHNVSATSSELRSLDTSTLASRVPSTPPTPQRWFGSRIQHTSRGPLHASSPVSAVPARPRRCDLGNFTFGCGVGIKPRDD